MTEVPVCSLRIGVLRLPTVGGGYLRMWPYAVARRAVQRMNDAGEAAVLYIHPYEFAPNELHELGVAIPWRMRMHQGLGRRGVPSKIGRLLGEFRFGTVRDALTGGGPVMHDLVHATGPMKCRRSPSAPPAKTTPTTPILVFANIRNPVAATITANQSV